MCHDVCIPASQDLEIALPVRAPQALHPTTEAAAFARTRACIPHALKLADAAATRAGTRVTLAFAAPPGPIPHRLEFFALEPGRIEPSAPQTLTTEGRTVRLELSAAQPVGADFRALRGVLSADGGPDAGGWAGTVEVPLH
jgi:DsbC/DsbD-like thiol-disulfide interchange protein